jgi:F-type H+-transporting ATPase subunit a
MEITPDQKIYAQWGPLVLNATLVFTWATMAVLVIGCWLVTRRLSTGVVRSRWQNLLEVVVATIRDQIREISQDKPDRYLFFIGTLFLFTAVANALTIVPGYEPPTASLSTTAALAACVFFAVPIYGISRNGVQSYLRTYAQPSVVMLPFNVIGEVSRTLALAVRLFGNIMSGTLIVAILLSLVPLFFPVVMRAFGLLIGLIQAYIFAVLAMVYIASGTRAERQREDKGTARNRSTTT